MGIEAVRSLGEDLTKKNTLLKLYLGVARPKYDTLDFLMLYIFLCCIFSCAFFLLVFGFGLVSVTER